MAPIEGDWDDDDGDWLEEDDGDDEPELVAKEEPETKITVELETEDVVVMKVSAATSKSIRSIVSSEFPLAMTEVSFSFLIIISWIPRFLKVIEYNTICGNV